MRAVGNRRPLDRVDRLTMVALPRVVVGAVGQEDDSGRRTRLQLFVNALPARGGGGAIAGEVRAKFVAVARQMIHEGLVAGRRDPTKRVALRPEGAAVPTPEHDEPQPEALGA